MSDALHRRTSSTRLRLWTGVSLLLIVPLGFASKFYAGPAAFWANNSLGGVFYELFWCLLFCLILPARKPWKIATAVFIGTCGVEVLQLWRPPLLTALRHTFVGRTLLGTTFTWSDFPYYLFGCCLGWLWMYILAPRVGRGQ